MHHITLENFLCGYFPGIINMTEICFFYNNIIYLANLQNKMNKITSDA